MAVLNYGGFGILVMPWAYHVVGMTGVLAFFTLFCFSGMIFVRHLPASQPA